MTYGPRGYGPKSGTICTRGMTFGPSPLKPLGAQSKKSKQVPREGSRYAGIQNAMMGPPSATISSTATAPMSKPARTKSFVSHTPLA